MRMILLIFLAISSFSFSALAETDFTGLRLTGTGFVEQVIDPLTLTLRGGRIIRLSALEIPDLHDSGDIALEALTLLRETLPKGTEIRLYQTQTAQKGRTNRMGHDLAHIVHKRENIWIQGLLVERGLARVLPLPETPEMIAQLYALENQARAEEKGLWPDYPIITPKTAKDNLHAFQIFEGVIHSISTPSNAIVFHFGPDRRKDPRISTNSTVRRALTAQGNDPMSLSGRTIRARGWLREWDGPYMEIDNPVYIELP